MQSIGQTGPLMTIALDPNAFGLPLLTWTALGTMAGVLVGCSLFLRRASDLGADRRTLYGIVIAALLGGLLGARLLHIADYWDFYARAPFQALYLWNGGLSLWGGALGGLAAGLCAARRQGLPLPETSAAATVPALVGLAIGRAGDLLAGERAATGSMAPWAVVYANESTEAYAGGASVHPVALYELMLDLAIAAAVTSWSRRLPSGAVMLAALAAWAGGRFLIAFVRLDPAHLGLQQTQWVGLVMLAGISIAALRSRKRQRR